MFKYATVSHQSEVHATTSPTTQYSEQQGEELDDTKASKSFTFDDPKQAFGSKTTVELLRAILVFKLCSVNLLVEKNKEVR